MSALPSSNQRQVSLRGASAKEITRDALLERIAHERQLRSYQRRASAAALFIQKSWRGYNVIKKVSNQLHEEWEAVSNHPNKNTTCSWISNNLLRPFLFLVTKSSVLCPKLRTENLKCMSRCFSIVLQSINSAEAEKNFCSLAVGTPMEKSTWLYQSQKLLSLPISMLLECDKTSHEDDIVAVVALGMRLVVCLTDSRAWKSLRAAEAGDADIAIKRLIEYMTKSQTSIYYCLRIYILNHSSRSNSQSRNMNLSENHLLIMASAVTLALRPFHLKKPYKDIADDIDINNASRCYFRFILTIPYMTQCMPSVLLPALKHEYVLLPCLSYLLVARDNTFDEIFAPDNLKASNQCLKLIPSSGWALANVVDLAIEHKNNSGSSECFTKNLDCQLYVRVANCISEYFVNWLEKNAGLVKQDGDDIFLSDDLFPETDDTDNCRNVKSSYIDFLKPVHQQWHLLKLLNVAKNNIPADTSKQGSIYAGNFNLIDVAYFYSYMLQIFSLLNPGVGSFPMLNMLSFTPGFLVELWEALDSSIFQGFMRQGDRTYKDANFENKQEAMSNPRQGECIKDSGRRWVNVLQKISGKLSDESHSRINKKPTTVQLNENTYDLWDIDAMKQGSQGISKDLSIMLHLFSATYAHLLLVLDDIEFYEKQVPFTLQQQRRIAAVLNTLVYNSFAQTTSHGNKSLLDAAIKCLQLLYERDCRHRFCPSLLWLAPARKSRITIVAAARAHEAAFLNPRCSEPLSITALSSVLTIVPHVYPFEERVDMFREFIMRDKTSRRLAGEISGLGAGSVEIVIRRNHIIEDGYKQLNSLGSRLKSCINVSFVSECGLPEAGLDYGGLSKELLTDLSKAIFDPEYGLFTQTSTSESSLIPNMAAKILENSIDMIEFLGRLVGKALYEGILLDYSFSLVFVQKLLGRYSFLDELSTLDPELHKNLMYVKHFDGDVAELILDFTVTEELCGKKVVTELKPGGRNISVTNENKLQYIHAMADYKLNRQIFPFANAFYRGLIDLISPSWLSLFNANEFNQLLSGGRHDFEVDDLRSHTKYSGGYSETSRTVKIFWEVVRGFKPSERCMLLKFVTSCSRAPLLGFKHLQPTFTIHKVPCDVPLWASLGGQDVDRLPSASTCYNTLKLPTYKRASTLRSKLLYAISSNTGFELS